MNKTIGLKTFLALGFIFPALISCNSNKTVTPDNSKLKEETTDVNSDEDFIDSEYQLYHVVVAGEGYNYDSLRYRATEVAEFLGVKVDTFSRYHNTERRKIVLPDNYEDDIWAGEYYLRRSNENGISIEMRTSYLDTFIEKNSEREEAFYRDTARMFVFVNMYERLENADSMKTILLQRFPETYVIPTYIFMGCMH